MTRHSRPNTSLDLSLIVGIDPFVAGLLSVRDITELLDYYLPRKRNDEQQLIDRIDKNLLDPYFAIWREIGRKGTVENSAMVLWRYLQRSPGYRKRRTVKLFANSDLQRVDMGIAMSHFELTARQLGLNGGWEVNPPQDAALKGLAEYTVSWVD